jgi:hypothetical protein
MPSFEIAWVDGNFHLFLKALLLPFTKTIVGEHSADPDEYSLIFSFLEQKINGLDSIEQRTKFILQHKHSYAFFGATPLDRGDSLIREMKDDAISLLNLLGVSTKWLRPYFKEGL